MFADMVSLSETHEYLRHTIYAVGAWYLNHRESSLQYQTQGVESLIPAVSRANMISARLKAILSTQVLLLQLAVRCIFPLLFHKLVAQILTIVKVINPESYETWCSMIDNHGVLLQHSAGYPETLSLRVRLASHHVLANTIEQKTNAFPNWSFLSIKEETNTEIDAMIATSPEVLNIIQSITILSFTNPNDYDEAASIAERLRNVQQICSDAGISMQKRQIMQATADTYRLGALIYLHCRFP